MQAIKNPASAGSVARFGVKSGGGSDEAPNVIQARHVIQGTGDSKPTCCSPEFLRSRSLLVQTQVELADLTEAADVSGFTEWTHAEGINVRAIREAGYLPALLQVLYVANHFEFSKGQDGRARPSAVFEIRDRDDETVIDILALDTATPERFASMFGLAPMLGLYQAYSPYTYRQGKALRIHRTPMGWLKAGCEGAVILKPESAWLDLPRLPGPILAEDVRHACEIQKLTAGFLSPERILFDE